MSGKRRQTIAIVGNGSIPEGHAAEIDDCDIVMRFNESSNGPDRTGTKTDLLFLVNSGKPIQKWLASPQFIASPAFSNAERLVFPYHPTIIARYLPKPNLLSRAKGRRADWTMRAIDQFGRAGKEILILPPDFYEECCDELGISPSDRRRVFPSTGFIGIRYALTLWPTADNRYKLFGFSWEGWKRHSWDVEREWIGARLSDN